MIPLQRKQPGASATKTETEDRGWRIENRESGRRAGSALSRRFDREVPSAAKAATKTRNISRKGAKHVLSGVEGPERKK
jgi:hypothetical protein